MALTWACHALWDLLWPWLRFRILCGVDVNVGGDSCTFLGSLSKALDRYITANDRRGTVVVGKDPAG